MGRIKLLLTQRLLRFRGARAIVQARQLHSARGYGEFADCCVAFAREHEGSGLRSWCADIVARRIPADWRKVERSIVKLPEGVARDEGGDLFTGRSFPADAQLSFSDALSVLHFAAFLTPQGTAVSSPPSEEGGLESALLGLAKRASHRANLSIFRDELAPRSANVICDEARTSIR